MLTEAPVMYGGVTSASGGGDGRVSGGYAGGSNGGDHGDGGDGGGGEGGAC